MAAKKKIAKKKAKKKAAKNMQVTMGAEDLVAALQRNRGRLNTRGSEMLRKSRKKRAKKKSNG